MSSVADSLAMRVCVGVLAELVYDDVFSTWEAEHMLSAHYIQFISLALVEVYHDTILESNMGFVDITKFSNGTHMTRVLPEGCGLLEDPFLGPQEEWRFTETDRQ